MRKEDFKTAVAYIFSFFVIVMSFFITVIYNIETTPQPTQLEQQVPLQVPQIELIPEEDTGDWHSL